MSNGARSLNFDSRGTRRPCAAVLVSSKITRHGVLPDAGKLNKKTRRAGFRPGGRDGRSCTAWSRPPLPMRLGWPQTTHAFQSLSASPALGPRPGFLALRLASGSLVCPVPLRSAYLLPTPKSSSLVHGGRVLSWPCVPVRVGGGKGGKAVSPPCIKVDAAKKGIGGPARFRSASRWASETRGGVKGVTPHPFPCFEFTQSQYPQLCRVHLDAQIAHILLHQNLPSPNTQAGSQGCAESELSKEATTSNVLESPTDPTAKHS